MFFFSFDAGVGCFQNSVQTSLLGMPAWKTYCEHGDVEKMLLPGRTLMLNKSGGRPADVFVDCQIDYVVKTLRGTGHEREVEVVLRVIRCGYPLAQCAGIAEDGEKWHLVFKNRGTTITTAPGSMAMLEIPVTWNNFMNFVTDVVQKLRAFGMVHMDWQLRNILFHAIHGFTMIDFGKMLFPGECGHVGSKKISAESSLELLVAVALEQLQSSAFSPRHQGVLQQTMARLMLAANDRDLPSGPSRDRVLSRR